MTDLSNSDDNDELNHRTINYFETKINLTDKNKIINQTENSINNKNINNNNLNSNPIEIKEDTEIIENNIIEENSFSNIIDNENENDNFSNNIEIKNVMNDNFIEEPQTGITARKNKNNNNNFDNLSLNNKENNNNNNNKNILNENFSGNENFIHCRNCLKFFSYFLSKNFINKLINR